MDAALRGLPRGGTATSVSRPHQHPDRAEEPRTIGRLARKLRVLLRSGAFYGPLRTLDHALHFVVWVVARDVLKWRRIRRKVMGHSMELDLRTGGISRPLFIYGARERDMLRILEHGLQPGSRVIDIGANIGYYALFAAGLVGPGGAVLAFEPDPRNRDLLRRNVARNRFEDRVRIHIEAISDRDARLDFGLHAESNLNAVIGGPDGGGCGSFAARASVAARDVAEVLRESAPTDLIRMDIEGYETTILSRIADLAEGGELEALPRRIVFEAHPDLYAPEFAIRRVLGRLFRVGYAPEWLTAFHDDDPPPLAALGLTAFDTVRSDYHTWGLYREPGEAALLGAICDLRCARHVLLQRREG